MWNRKAVTVRIALLVGLVGAGVACTQKAADATKHGVDTALEATKSGANKAIDATKNASDKALDVTKAAGDKTSNVAQQAADKTKGAVIVTGNAVTDTWITGKLKVKFADETVLKGSDIKITTSAHVVTLSGTVASDTAKDRAGAIASGTDGVVDVVNNLIVK
jgi:hyperosmotically inducible periplasmic protein